MRKLTEKQKENIKEHNFKVLDKNKLANISRKGQKASVKARKENKSIKDIINIIADTEIKDKSQKGILQKLGLNGTYKDYAFFILLDKAINGKNIQALNKLLDYFAIYDKSSSEENETFTAIISMLDNTAQNDWGA